MHRKLIALVLICLSLAACSKQPEPLRDVTVTHQDGTQTFFKVEIADNNEERMHGLMGRQSLADQHGMLFLFPQQQMLSFWMKNTPIFLDIIFIDQDGRIVHIHPKARPFDETLLSSEKPARYVLEIKGGEAERLKVKTGDLVTF